MDTAPEKPDYRKIVAKIDKLIEDFIDGGGQRTTSIGGVSFEYASLRDLERLRGRYVSMAIAEEVRAGTLRSPYVINTTMRV